MDKVNTGKWKSMKIPPELHELLVDIKYKTDISMVTYMKKAVEAQWEKDKKNVE